MIKQQSDRLGKEPIPKLLINLALPAMFGTFVMALHNVIDTFFIARAVGTIGVAAVSIAFPVQMIVMALAGSIGIGGASIISRKLGANDTDEANQVFGNVISIVLLISIVGFILGLSLLTATLRLFGSSETILPFAQDYLGIILYGTVFFAFAMSMNNIIRSEGNAKIAMLAMVIAAVLNIIFTPIFIFGLGLGIKGSAFATILSQGITVCYLVWYFAAGKSSLSFKFAFLRPKLLIIKQVLAIGSSAFVHMAAGSVMLIVANHMLVFYGGDLAVAVFGIIHKVLMFWLMPIMGIMQGLLPIVGYNYGANLHQRVSESIILAFKVTTTMAMLAFITIMIFPKPIILIFTNEVAALQMGQTALKIMAAFYLTIGISMITSSVFQGLGKAKEAFILSMSRQVLFLIPLLLTLPLKFGLTGVWLPFPLADLLSFLLALWFINKNKSIFFATKGTITSR